MHRVILDTDIGSDVDDACALSFCLRHPEIQLEAVTCVYADVDIRAKIASKFVQTAEQEVPVAKGLSQPLLREGDIYWGGHEGAEILAEGDEYTQITDTRAVDLIVETVLGSPGEIDVITVGPLTNLAAAMICEPAIIEAMRSLTVMGGLAFPDADRLGRIEHNIRCDPEAARVVFASGREITMVGLDVTLQARITREGIQRLRDSGDALCVLLAGALEHYVNMCQRDFTYLHDPLACAVLVQPELVSTRACRIEVPIAGDEHIRGQTIPCPVPENGAPTHACETVNAPAFLQLFLDTLIP